MVRLRLSLYAGIAAAFPVWAWQAARFVSSGPFLDAAILLCAAGTVFGYYLLGMTIRVLVTLFPPQIEYLLSAADYLSFVACVLLGCWFAFQLPCMPLLLVSVGVIRGETLRRQRRVAWFILFAFAEIITPVADPIVAPLTVIAPLLVLYEVSALVARRMDARRLAR